MSGRVHTPRGYNRGPGKTSGRRRSPDGDEYDFGLGHRRRHVRGELEPAVRDVAGDQGNQAGFVDGNMARPGGARSSTGRRPGT